MNEEELTRLALGDPLPDPAARERARAQLRRRFSGERPHVRSRRITIVPVVAALGIAITLVATTIPRGDAAASELKRLRAVAARFPAPHVAAGESLHVETEVFGLEGHSIVGTADHIDRVVRYRYEIWQEADGAGHSERTYLEARFASPADRETWLRYGSPQLPQAGDVARDQFSSSDPLLYDFSELSTDPATLFHELRSSVYFDKPPSDDQVFGLIGDLLNQGPMTVQQQAALFTVAQDLQGTDLVGDVTDPLGRPGVGIAVPGPITVTMLVFDESTAQPLAVETFPLDADLQNAAPTDWEAFQPVEVVPSEAAGKSG